METYSFAELVSVAHCSELIIADKKTDNDDISSQISAQIFEFFYHDLFSETLQNSEEVTSCSKCCYEENNSSTYPQSLSLAQELENFTNNVSNTNTNNYSEVGPKTVPPDPSAIIFDAQEDIDSDISASIDFSLPPQFDFPSYAPPAVGPVPQQAPPPLPPVFEEDCLSGGGGVPSPFPFLGPTAMGTYLPAALSAAAEGLFSGPAGLLMPAELQPQELNYHHHPDTAAAVGIFCPDPMQRVFNHPAELQGIGSEASQQLIGGGAGNSGSLGTDIPNMGDQTFKVGKLSVEQRKEKIHRYMKKRNERNFSKKIKYACRKTLADSRPRVRGRFAKNDDFGEAPRAASSNHEEDDEEEVVVKEEDGMVDSSDIFAHISGVNSFKCNYPIQSWI